MRWQELPLRDVAPARAATVEFDSDNVAWQLSLDQIESETGEIKCKRYANVSESGSSTFRFDTSNVLYSKLRPYLNKVVIPDELGVATTELIPLRPDPEILNARYLAYYLRSKRFVSQASHHVAGAKMPRVVMDWFWSHKMPLAPPSEQTRIVEVLDEADHLRKLRREADAKAARILPALFLKMFGDPATNPMGWPVKPFRAVFNDETSGHVKVQAKTFQPSGKLPIIDQGANQIAGYVDDASIAYSCALPAIVFGDHTRIFKFVDHPFALGADGVRVLTTKNGFVPLFVYWHCRLHDIPSAGYSRHFKYLKEKTFIKPSPESQQVFARHAAAVAKNLECVDKGSSGIGTLFSALLARAFSGQLTAKWRQTHMQELLTEMREQASLLDLPMPKELEVNS